MRKGWYVKARVIKTLLLAAAAAVAVILYRGFPVRVGSATSHHSTPLHQTLTQHTSIDHAKAPESDTHALKVLAMALEKKPGHTPVLFKMAKMESDEGHYQEAALHLRQIVQREPGNPEARLELGKALFQLGDVQGAITQTEEILKTHPTYEDALYNLGAIYGNLGNRERALSYWKRLAALDPRSESGQKAQQMMSKLQPDTP